MKKLVSLLVVFFSLSLFSQTIKLDSLSSLLKNATSDYEIANANLQLAKAYETINIAKSKDFSFKSLQFKSSDSLRAMTHNQLGRISFFESKLDSSIYYFNKTKQFFEGTNNQKNVAEIKISIGAVQLKQGNYNATIKTLTESATFFEKINDQLNAAKCYNNIASAFAELNKYPKAIEYSTKALQVFNEQNQMQFQLITLSNLAMQFYKNGDTLQAINNNLIAEKIGVKVGDKRSLSIIYNNLGIVYLDKNPKKAKEYINKTLELKEELKLKDGIDIALKNLGYLYFKEKDYPKAIHYFKQAENQANGKQLIAAYTGLKDSYKALNRLELALKYSEKETFLTDSLLNTETQKEFLKIQTKYETEIKEREIAELKSKNREISYKQKMNNYLLYMLLGLFVITLLLIYFALKSLKRKKLLARQNFTLKTKKLEKLLKNQELDGVDAILDAQEKERAKIANDLHDNLGSKIATLKLYIDEVTTNENSSKNEKNQLVTKLKDLADETYKEIRAIAHQKKFGTFIDIGLIPSIQAIANQISSSHKLAIKVINVNVEKHISNTIEIQIFRVIQELLTNCIKHANASEIIIQFSVYDNILNVTVEDNGKGFDKNKIPFGYGLKNVEKRIEKIGGIIDIDTDLGKGTSIIVNIAL